MAGTSFSGIYDIKKTIGFFRIMSPAAIFEILLGVLVAEETFDGLFLGLVENI